MIYLRVAGYVLWAISIPGSVWAAKELHVWNGDVFTAGLSGGMLVTILAHKISVRLDKSLALSKENLTELDRVIWRLRGQLHRMRRGKT